MAFVDLNTVHNPAAGAVAPAAWGDAVRDNDQDLDARTTGTTAVVETSETTTSTTYANLATSGPGVTVTTGTVAFVLISAYVENSAAGNFSIVGVDVAGASSIVATDTRALRFKAGAAGQAASMTFGFLITNLTPGSNSFTLRYRVTAGTGTFANRVITVWPGNKLA